MIIRSLSRPATVVAHQIYISRGLGNVYVALVTQNLADYRETESSILQVLHQKKRWANEASRSPVGMPIRGIWGRHAQNGQRMPSYVST
jgi:hypothetical protein